MRPIEFRAWDRKSECWLPHETDVRIGINGAAHYHIHEDGGYYANGKCKEHDIVLVQFTGLKDKNGREIYEGDIVKGADVLKGYIFQEVAFRNGSFGTLARGTHQDGTQWEDCSDYIEERMKVVGNIYQDAGLLS